MKKAKRAVTNSHQKRFVDLFDKLCYSRNRHSVWSDFVLMAAIEISNAVDQVNAPERAETYMRIAKQYNSSEKEILGQMLGAVVDGMEESTDQDFLGELYMALELGNDHAGQFFTPYCVCKAMAKITAPNIPDEISKRGWIGVNDPACGAGATLVAFANECRDQGVNYQTSVLFVAQDIDYTVGCMCYLQLSLMGCAGYVIIDNSITNPSTSYDKHGLLPSNKPSTIWYTPFYFRDMWHWRRVAAQMDLFFQNAKPVTETKVVEEPPQEEQIEFLVEKNGQLRLF